MGSRWTDDEYADDDLSPLEELEQLVEDNHPSLRDDLLEALNDPDREVRIAASVYLAELFHDTRSLPGLYEGLVSRMRGTRLAAANAVWEIGDANPAALIRALNFERGTVRQAIGEALELVGWIPDDPESEIAYRIATWNWQALVSLGEIAVPGLVSVLSDPDGNVRRGACWTLGQIADPRCVPFLIATLTDEGGGLLGIGERVCDAAAEALLRIGTLEALEAVRAWRGEQAVPDEPEE